MNNYEHTIYIFVLFFFFKIFKYHRYLKGFIGCVYSVRLKSSVLAHSNGSGHEPLPSLTLTFLPACDTDSLQGGAEAHVTAAVIPTGRDTHTNTQLGMGEAS